MTKPIPTADMEHIANLHAWAAQAAARGDMESSERLQRGAHTVFDRAVAKVRNADRAA